MIKVDSRAPQAKKIRDGEESSLLGRTWKKITNNPIRSVLLILLIGSAVFVGYDALHNHFQILSMAYKGLENLSLTTDIGIGLVALAGALGLFVGRKTYKQCCVTNNIVEIHKDGLVEVASDGDCLIHCFRNFYALVSGNNLQSNVDLRNELVEEMRKACVGNEPFKPILLGSLLEHYETYDRSKIEQIQEALNTLDLAPLNEIIGTYLHCMKKPGIWGGYAEIFVWAAKYKVHVKVYNAGDENLVYEVNTNGQYKCYLSLKNRNHYNFYLPEVGDPFPAG